jgi:hypothetical protein
MSIIDRTDNETYQVLNESQSKLNSTIFFFTVIIVCSIELIASYLYSQINISPIMLTGIVRLIESICILSYIFMQKNCGAIGCGKNQILPGFYYGCVWSLCFGAIVLQFFFYAAIGSGLIYFVWCRCR